MTARGRKGSQSPLVLLAAEAWSRVDLRRARMNIEIGTGSPETNGRAIRENGRHTVPVNRNSTIWFGKDYQQWKLKSGTCDASYIVCISISELQKYFFVELIFIPNYCRKICLLLKIKL